VSNTLKHGDRLRQTKEGLMLIGLGTLSVVVISTLALSGNRIARGGSVIVWLTFVALTVGGYL